MRQPLPVRFQFALKSKLPGSPTRQRRQGKVRGWGVRFQLGLRLA